MTKMDESSSEDLRKALELLKSGDVNAARPILVKLLKTHPELEQAWYMLSFTVQDKRKQIYALEQVLELNPENLKARQRLGKISGDDEQGDEGTQEADSGDLLSQRMGSLSVNEAVDESSELSEPDQEEGVSERPPSKPTTRPVEPIQAPISNYDDGEPPNRKRLLYILIVIVVVVGGIAALYFGRNILSSGGGTSEEIATSTPFEGPTPTETPTERRGGQLDPTWTPTVTPTPTLTPLPTATKTPTSTPTPTQTLDITEEPET